jgi:hypothetical protein
MPSTRSLLAAAVLVAVVPACSTGYIPRRPGNIAVTMESGRFQYTRDGVRHDHGLLGGGLEDAVRGNPQAEAAAAEYTGRLQTGLLAMLLGTTGMMVGTIYGAHELTNGSESRGEKLLAVSLVSLVVMMGGAFYAASAEPYRWDAINIFNDNPMPQARPPAWGAAQDALRSVTPISSRAAAKRLMSVVPAPSSSNLESRASFSKPSSSM